MEKPIKVFDWAGGNDATITEPLTSQKESGFKAGDVPSASEFNWMLNTISKWQKYFDHRWETLEIPQIDQSWQGPVGQLKTEVADVERKLSALKKYVKEFHPSEGNPPGWDPSN